MHFKQNFVILVFALVLLAVFLYFRTNAEKPVIVTGTANPGRIMIYSFDGTDYKRSEIDTGYNLVWTVRTGDIYNKGKSVIVAGVGNSFLHSLLVARLLRMSSLQTDGRRMSLTQMWT